jgi:hypothetical protein
MTSLGTFLAHSGSNYSVAFHSFPGSFNLNVRHDFPFLVHFQNASPHSLRFLKLVKVWLITMVKVKLSLCLKHHTIKTYWWSGSIAPYILNLGIEWSWVVSFTPRCGCLTLGVRVYGTHWIGGGVGSRAGLDAVAKRKISTVIPDQNLTRFVQFVV